HAQDDQLLSGLRQSRIEGQRAFAVLPRSIERPLSAVRVSTVEVVPVRECAPRRRVRWVERDRTFEERNAFLVGRRIPGERRGPEVKVVRFRVLRLRRDGGSARRCSENRQETLIQSSRDLLLERDQ